MFGRYLELSIVTADIAASVQFYERLGFVQLITGDAWPHRYGVLSDGRIHIGLHEQPGPSPAVSFVAPGLAESAVRLAAAQLQPESVRLGEEELHQVRLRDPGGQAVRLLEARTYSPVALAAAGAESLCGYFLHLSLPQKDFARARAFWERGGFVALPETDEPYPHLPLTSDALDLAFHRPRLFDAPLLVFECADPVRQQAMLAERGFALVDELPRSFGAGDCSLLEAPEGTLLWSLRAAD
ncbi:MAG TPA: VOC family protein [Steroidobacteraceae bacterium]|jgi:catechol 2,3-dioxygenase-like lactoylglutathione lyase family enzyme